MDNLNQELVDNNYLVIRNFISSDRAKQLSDEYKEYCENNSVAGDDQSPNSHSFHNYISFLELLCEKTPQVSSIIGETVLPTYSYSRVYKQKSELVKHTDRDACEISLTVHLNGDSEWPIFILTPSGETRSVVLNPGDAMIYRGCIAPHWREKFNGEWYTQVFLHYVLSRGKRSYAYFDKERRSDIVEIEEVKTPEFILKETAEPKSRRRLEDFIISLDNIVPDELCDRILSEYKNSDEWLNSLVAGGIRDTNSRNCDMINMSLENIISNNSDVRRQLDMEMYECASKAINKYRELFPETATEIDTGYDLLRYNQGQFYTQHTDSFKDQQRAVSCSFHLNDDYEGGEFGFFDREIIIRAGKGGAILFPSNFMFPHEVMPVMSGTRYSIITWYV
jgi:hypothetical protein